MTARTNEKLVRLQGLGDTGVSPVCSEEQKSARAAQALKKPKASPSGPTVVNSAYHGNCFCAATKAVAFYLREQLTFAAAKA